jgi:hypothetical protein
MRTFFFLLARESSQNGAPIHPSNFLDFSEILDELGLEQKEKGPK